MDTLSTDYPLTVSSVTGFSDEREEEEYEKEEVGEDGEIILVSGDKVSGPWNKSGAPPPPAPSVGESFSCDPTSGHASHIGLSRMAHFLQILFNVLFSTNQLLLQRYCFCHCAVLFIVLCHHDSMSFCQALRSENKAVMSFL